MYSQVIIFIGVLVLLPLHAFANDFAGANSYFIFNLDSTDRNDILQAMYTANMKLLRVFITQVYEGSKGSSASGVDDLETVAVGQYDDTILEQIDLLAYEAHALDIKLVIAMHDRYALACDTTDAYVYKYDLPIGNCDPTIPDDTVFYTDSSAITDFDNRLLHILQYESPNFDGTPWGQLSDAIFSFEIENEAMGYMDIVSDGWWCGRAKVIRDQIGSSGIQISTGGGTDIALSTQEQFFNCDYLDIIAIHDYEIGPEYIEDNLNPVKTTALATGKRLLYEEFGAEGSNKQEDIQRATIMLMKTGVPWMYWELMIPGAGSSNYEVWTNEDSWNTLLTNSLETNQQPGEFSWPEIDGGGE